MARPAPPIVAPPGPRPNRAWLWALVAIPALCCGGILSVGGHESGLAGKAETYVHSNLPAYIGDPGARVTLSTAKTLPSGDGRTFVVTGRMDSEREGEHGYSVLVSARPNGDGSTSYAMADYSPVK